MNKEVYRFLLQAYGRNPGQWLGWLSEIIRTLLLRISVPIIFAWVAASISVGDLETAREGILLFLVVHIFGGSLGVVGELVSIRTENREYEKLLMNFYRRLVSKDMAFYRNHQTGYLASLFRQHLDSAMGLIRFLRGDVTKTLTSLIVPALVLIAVDWQIGLVALVVVALQAVYIAWSSAKAHRYREWSHEIYRKVTGEVSDEITNIVAFKSAGVEREAYRKVAGLANEEIKTFWLRRKTTTLLDFPRVVITGIGVAAAFYVLLASASNSAESVGLLVLTLTYMFQITRNVSELPSLIVEHDDFVTKLYPTLKYLSDEDETIRDPSKPKSLGFDQATIDMENVSFSYPASQDAGGRVIVFDDFDLHVEDGEQLGVVGLSGAGKARWPIC